MFLFDVHSTVSIAIDYLPAGSEVWEITAWGSEDSFQWMWHSNQGRREQRMPVLERLNVMRNRIFSNLRIVKNIRCLNTFTQQLLMSRYKIMTGVDYFIAHKFLCVLTAALVWLSLHHSWYRPRAPAGWGRWACPEEAEQSLPWNHISIYLAFIQL